MPLNIYRHRRGSSFAFTSLLRLLASSGSITRASVANHYDVAGIMQEVANHVARYEYNPTTGIYQGLKIEGAATNIQDEANNLSAWSTNGVFTLTQDATDPKGVANSAYTVDGDADYEGVYNSVPCVINTDYTLSGFVKHISGTGYDVRVGGDSSSFVGGSGRLEFNALTGALISQGAGIQSYTITNIGNGWWYWTILVTTGAAQVSFNQHCFHPTITQGKHAFWGNQTEIGKYATSLIETTGVAATRAAELADVPFSYNNGTFLIEFDTADIELQKRMFVISDGTNNNRYILRFDTGGYNLLCISGGATIANISGGTLTVGKHKIAVRIFEDDVSLVVDGVALGTDAATGALPTMTTLTFGSNWYGGSYLNGHIKYLKRHPSPLTDAQMQVLTS